MLDHALLRRLSPAIALTALLLGAGCATTPASRGDEARSPLQPEMCIDPDETLLASVVRVATGDGGDASGVVIGPDRVLTAAHVVTGAPRTLVMVDGGYREAAVLAMDEDADLALLGVGTGALRPLRLARSDLSAYEPVWAIGYPLALEQTTTRGRFNSITNGRLYASAPIQAGSSGGGLLRCRQGRFELAGIIRGYGARWLGGRLVSLPDLSIATPAEHIEHFVAARLAGARAESL